MSQVPYHIIEDTVYTLSYVTVNEQEFKSECKTKTDSNYLTRTYDFDDKVYCIYTSQLEFELEGKTSVQKGSQVTNKHPVITYTFLALFTNISEKADSYSPQKDSNFKKLDSVIDTVNWQEFVPIVSSQLLSNTIKSHPFPNANHRTALGFTLLYLNTTVSDFDVNDMPSMFQSFADAYIYNSKQILTVRRNTTQFQILKEAGCREVERKNGVTIPLADFEFTIDDPFSFYAAEHRRFSRTFIESLLYEMGCEKAIYTEGPEKEKFASDLLTEV